MCPYIQPELRQPLLESTVHELMNENLSVGDLNFIISSLLWAKFKELPNYANGNQLVGVLECAKLEFYRRQLAVLEDCKQSDNGDI